MSKPSKPGNMPATCGMHCAIGVAAMQRNSSVDWVRGLRTGSRSRILDFAGAASYHGERTIMRRERSFIDQLFESRHWWSAGIRIVLKARRDVLLYVSQNCMLLSTPGATSDLMPPDISTDPQTSKSLAKLCSETKLCYRYVAKFKPCWYVYGHLCTFRAPRRTASSHQRQRLPGCIHRPLPHCWVRPRSSFRR